MSQKRKRGRPPFSPGEVRRNKNWFRCRDRVLIECRRAALANGRSISEEIEARLEFAGLVIELAKTENAENLLKLIIALGQRA